MCSVDQGRLICCKDGFAKRRTQLHMQMCPGGHVCINQNRPVNIIAYAIMSSGWYCIEDIIACDTSIGLLIVLYTYILCHIIKTLKSCT